MEHFFSRCAVLVALILTGCGSESPPEPTELRQALPSACNSIDRTAMTAHSCGHADFGPFVSVNASASRDFAAASPNVNSVHTHYTIVLPGSSGAREGTVKYRPQRGGEWAIYVAPTTSLTVLDSAGNAVPLVMQQSIASCSLLNHVYVFNLTALATYRLVLGPSPRAQAAVVIEKLDDFQTFYFADADRDGFGDSGDLVTTMCEAPAGRVTDDADCDDGNAAINPSALELCDGADNDCDGQVDDDAATASYLDADGDGHGDASQPSTACPAPPGYVVANDDCDDSDPDSYPGAEEICDGNDNDCNGDTDEGLNSSPTTCGVGACRSAGTISCFSGIMADSCSPGTPAANDASCNAVDDDCDGQTDEDFVGTATTCGVGSCQQAGATSCVGGTVVDSCNAGGSGTEICDGTDNDCDGETDEGVLNACGACGAAPVETCDGEDNDCNGLVDDVAGGCSSALCGDGAIDHEGGEECDDGNAEVGDGCNQCQLECSDVTPEATSHTCSHVGFGPFESVPAQAYPGFIFGDISAPHTHFTVGLPAGSDSAPAAVIYYPTQSGPFAFYSDTDEPLSLVRVSDGVAMPLRFERSVSLCGEGLAWVRVYELDETEMYHLVLGPTPRTETAVIAEYLPSFGRGYYMRDVDNDGWGDEDSAINVWCTLENNPFIVPDMGGDCDPESASVNPGATEVCNGLDDNCQGGIDDVIYGYRDVDGDGYGDWTDSVRSCILPEGYVVNDDDSWDCDDTNSAVHSGAPEICDELDNDCDNEFDEDPSCGSDCVPAPEICDGIDNDCDALIDEAGVATFYADADGDGFGDPALPVLACAALPGYVIEGRDCDDGNAAIYPGAKESCNALDDDCDGEVDNLQDPLAHAVEHSCHHAELGPFVGVQPAIFGTTPLPNVSAARTAYLVSLGNPLPGIVTYTPTATGDFAVLLSADVPFTIENSSGVALGLELDEPAAACRSLARLKLAELEAGEDYRFVFGSVATPSVLLIVEAVGGHPHEGDDGEAAHGTEFFRDADGDGHGTPSGSLIACSTPDGYVTTSDDCDDSSAATHEGAAETCDGQDNDCDGDIDEEGATNPRAFYGDADGDGHGSDSVSVVDCDAPAGFVNTAGDCNDTDPAVHPRAEELCNGQDDDCDGVADSGSLSFYRDHDRDGFGDERQLIYACEAPPGYSASPGDCDDESAAISPGATESCDGEDNDCDGTVDNGDVCECRPLTLQATRLHHLSWSWGGTLKLDRSTRIAIPGSLTVVRGNAAKGEATLKVRKIGTRRDIACRYRAAPGGRKYVLKSCSGGLAAGGQVETRRVTLRLDGGERGHVTTKVTVELENLSCHSREWACP